MSYSASEHYWKIRAGCPRCIARGSNHPGDVFREPVPRPYDGSARTTYEVYCLQCGWRASWREWEDIQRKQHTRSV